MDPFFGDNV